MEAETVLLHAVAILREISPALDDLLADALRSLSPVEVGEMNELVAASRASVWTALGGDRDQWMVVTRTGDAGGGVVAFEFP